MNGNRLCKILSLESNSNKSNFLKALETGGGQTMT